MAIQSKIERLEQRQAARSGGNGSRRNWYVERDQVYARYMLSGDASPAGMRELIASGGETTAQRRKLLEADPAWQRLEATKPASAKRADRYCAANPLINTAELMAHLRENMARCGVEPGMPGLDTVEDAAPSLASGARIDDQAPGDARIPPAQGNGSRGDKLAPFREHDSISGEYDETFGHLFKPDK